MAAQFTVDVNRRLVLVVFEGDTPLAEIIGLDSLIRAHPDFDPSFSEIIDASGVAGNVTISTDDLRELARRKTIFGPTSMSVIIAPRDYIFGLARMGQVFAEKTHPNVAVVRSMEEALALLSERGQARFAV
jgi:hypothetical protein